MLISDGPDPICSWHLAREILTPNTSIWTFVCRIRHRRPAHPRLAHEHWRNCSGWGACCPFICGIFDCSLFWLLFSYSLVQLAKNLLITHDIVDFGWIFLGRLVVIKHLPYGKNRDELWFLWILPQKTIKTTKAIKMTINGNLNNATENICVPVSA